MPTGSFDSEAFRETNNTTRRMTHLGVNDLHACGDVLLCGGRVARRASHPHGDLGQPAKGIILCVIAKDVPELQQEVSSLASDGPVRAHFVFRVSAELSAATRIQL